MRRFVGYLLRPILKRFAGEMPPVPWQLYPGYSALERGLIDAYFRVAPVPEAGFILDRLGVRTDPAVLWDGLANLSGTVMPPPYEADFHAEGVEWIGMLKAVAAAERRFVAMEAGAGWGPWLVAGTAAARGRGITDFRLLGVEADPQHYQSMLAHFRNNGLDPAAHKLHCAAVGARDGVARWSRLPDPRNDWGGRLKADGSDQDTMEVRILGIAGLLAAERV